MRRLLRYAASAVILIGIALLSRALFIVFTPVTTSLPTDRSIGDLFAARLTIALAVILVGLFGYLVGGAGLRRVRLG